MCQPYLITKNIDIDQNKINTEIDRVINKMIRKLLRSCSSPCETCPSTSSKTIEGILRALKQESDRKAQQCTSATKTKHEHPCWWAHPRLAITAPVERHPRAATLIMLAIPFLLVTAALLVRGPRGSYSYGTLLMNTPAPALTLDRTTMTPRPTPMCPDERCGQIVVAPETVTLNENLLLREPGTAENQSSDREMCKKTCKLQVVESIPENITFDGATLPPTTFWAWKKLLELAQKDLDVAAYKTSLRGKHVLNGNYTMTPGDEIFEMLTNASLQRNVVIRMVENYPPKDPGDNEDGRSLERRGIVERRPVNFQRLFGYGAMHSKFVVVDQKHFYMGSANLDWRSLNQKMELGVLVTDCPCLGQDLKKIFNTYWAVANLDPESVGNEQSEQFCPSRSNRANCGSPNAGMRTAELVKYLINDDTSISRSNALTICYKNVDMPVYLAASPQDLNSALRTWDLDAILQTINRAERFVYIHVMDYIPMMVYRKPQKFWPVIDDAVRKAAIERGVEVKFLVAALHFVEKMLYFMKSLQDFNGAVDKGSIEIKIFKVPIVTKFQTKVARDRRTHNKFMVTDSTVVIGTSNWSGDYFYGSTGVALVANQTGTEQRPFVDDMREIFMRDWNSAYAHPLDSYMKHCLWRKDGAAMCQTEKDDAK